MRNDKIQITATYKVNYSDTLLEFLLKKMNLSRNNVKRLLANKQVLINGSLISQYNFPLAKDDVISITKHSVNEENMLKVHTKEKKRRIPRLEIIYEDEDFIAINKPNGLLSIETDKKHMETAYNYLQEYFYEESKKRIYLLHRIDKETSGVLLFTTNPKVYSKLKLNWNDYILKREYIAIIEGHLNNKEGSITNHLVENINNIVYVSKNNVGQKAITNYKVMKENPKYSLLLVDIKTGRKNQIRATFSNLGNPIIGDDKYNSQTSPLKRLGLHASLLAFKHPFTNKVIEIKAKAPNTFYSLFNNDKNRM